MKQIGAEMSCHISKDTLDELSTLLDFNSYVESYSHQKLMATQYL